MRASLIVPLFAAALGWAASSVRADNTALDASFATSGRFNQSFPDTVHFKTLAHLPRPTGGSVAVVHYRFTSAGACVTFDCLGLYRFTDAGVALSALTMPTALNFASVGGAAIDSLGRIVVVGSVQTTGANRDFRVVRILPDGTADTSFSGDGIADIAFDLGGNNGDYANAVAIDAQDRIVVVGQVQRTTADDTDYGSARLLSDGTLDPNFNSGGKRVTLFDLAATLRIDSATAVVVGNDGRITIGGIAIDGALGVSRIGLVRLTAAGGPDVSFCPGSCTYQGSYGAIHSGRRVIFYGNDVPAVADGLNAMSINAAGELLTAGTTPGAGETLGYVQKFDTSGNWVAEVSTEGGLGDGGMVWIGGVHWANPAVANSNVILTGSVGPNEEFFFAQRFDGALNASANWGTLGPSNSVYAWTASGGFGDVGDNRPAKSAIDPGGRVLVGGSYKVSQLSDPYSITVSRLSYNGAPLSPAIFQNSFE